METLYKQNRRKIPKRARKRISSQKAKFYGMLFNEISKSGGYPVNFIPESMQNMTVDTLTDILFCNNLEISIKYKSQTNNKRNNSGKSIHTKRKKFPR